MSSFHVYESELGNSHETATPFHQSLKARNEARQRSVGYLRRPTLDGLYTAMVLVMGDRPRVSRQHTADHALKDPTMDHKPRLQPTHPEAKGTLSLRNCLVHHSHGYIDFVLPSRRPVCYPARTEIKYSTIWTPWYRSVV
jgi:hypothetical protein